MQLYAFFRLIIIGSLFLLGIPTLPAQSPSPPCGTDQLHLQTQAQNPGLLQLNRLFERRWQSQQIQGQGSARQVQTIPVVVHLVHNNGPANLTAAQVQQAIDALNDGMRNRSFFNPQTGVDTEIELCMAARDPQGNATNGITRTQSNLTQMVLETQDSLLKALIQWDPHQYLNIWVVSNINSKAAGPGVAGYSTLPMSHGTRRDGIVGEAAYFNTQKANISIFVHELGHYLGLYHTFHGGCTNNNCLADGDKVCDTPPDASVSPAACNASPNSCQTDEDDTSIQNPFRPQNMGGLGDQSDMIINYMDYGDPTCIEAFTQGQKDRMHFFLTSIRSSLLQSPGCLSPCTSHVVASFNMTNLPVSVGSTLQLQYSGMGNVSTYDWQVNGQSFAQTANAQYALTQKGTYIFSLTVQGPFGNCFDTFLDTLEVFCEPRAEINGWQAYMLPGDTLKLSANTGSNGYTWLLNGAIASTGPNFNFTFASASSVLIQLIADNGDCQDTTIRVVRVGGCGLYDQQQKSYWALDDSMMMDFTVNPPIIRTAGSIIGTSIGSSTVLEQNVTISDEFENLLFYSNGEVVWDRNHQVMPNGSGLLGHGSTRQGIIAFQDPADPAIYYLFTLDAMENGFANGLRYSKIDMRLRGGMGDVIAGQKNQYVMTTYLESMHAVYHANGRDVWLVVKQKNSLNARTYNLVVIPITTQGVQSNNLISLLIQTPSQFSLLRFSHSGQWLADGYSLYHFDRQTGIPQLFMSLGTLGWGMGFEFSPDESKIYYLERTGNFSRLVQFDLSLGTPANIRNSITILHTTINPGLFLSKIEMGKDQKLYIASFSVRGLHVIQNPNLAGTASNFQLLGAPFPNNIRTNTFGLPDYIRGKEKVDSLSLTLQVDPVNPCPGEPVTVWPALLRGNYVLDYQILGDATHRQKGDTLILIPQRKDTLQIFARFRNACEIQYDTLTIPVKSGPLIDLGPDQTLCTSPIHVKADSLPHSQYVWSNMQVGRLGSFSQPGQYVLTAIDTLSGCQHRDSILIIPPPPAIPPDLGLNQRICEGDVFVLRVNGNYASIKWWDGQSQASRTVFAAGKYWVEVEDACGNRSSDTIVISYYPIQQVSIRDSAFFCPGEAVAVDINAAGFSNYQWLDGPVGSLRTFSQVGTYFWSMNDQYGCDVLDSISIDSRPVNYPIGLVPSQIICEGDTFSIDATTTGWLSYLWNDGFVGPIRHLSKAGIYALEVVDAFGCSQRDSIDLYTIPPADTPDLGPDRKFCFGEVFALNLEVDSKFATINWWDGGSNSLRSVDEAGTYWVEVTDSCGNVFSDTIKISLHPQIPGDLPDSIFFCPQESMQVDITTDDITSYHWNDGVTGAIRTFNQVGTYVVIIQDINACKWSESLYIGQRPQHPAINLIPATTICEGESISLDPTTPGWIHYEWRDGYIGAAREFDQTGQYSLIVSDAYNCSTTAHTEVIVENCLFDIYLPNAFSPNGDGHNDWFGVPYRSNVSAYQLTIYNRWGNLLYESNDPNPGWDGYYKGGTCPEGVYVYLLNYWGLDGQFYQKRGTVTLIR